MAKEFKRIAFDPIKCRSELTDLSNLLKSNADLSERQDIQPFFESHEHLSAFLGSYTADIGPATDIVFEYPILGNFKADLIVGNKAARAFCFIEFEDGTSKSIFKGNPKRGMSEWSSRFAHGFSQIVDWFSLLDDLKKTDLFKKDFGKEHVRFSALLVIGRDQGVSDYDRLRLDWRRAKVLVDSQAAFCITFDEVYKDLDRRLRLNTDQ